MKRLYKSRDDSVLTGLCGGLGEYFGVDSTLIRLVFVFFGFTGVGILAYVIGALVLPTKPSGDYHYKEKTRDNNSSFFIGSVLVLLGVYMIFKRFLIHLLPSYTRDLIWPLIFIGLGAYLVWGRKES